jgi:hypothetical protein
MHIKLLKLLKSKNKRKLYQFQMTIDKSSYIELFNHPLILNYLYQPNYNDHNFIYQYYPLHIKSLPHLITYYLKKYPSAVYKYLPNSYQKDQSIIEYVLKKDSITYINLPYNEKCKMKHVSIMAHANVELLTKFLINNDNDSIDIVHYEEKEIFQAMPKFIKEKLGINHLTYNTIQDLSLYICTFIAKSNLNKKLHKNLTTHLHDIKANKI